VCLASAIGTYREWPATGGLAGDLVCSWTHALPPVPVPAFQVVPDGCIDIIWTGESLRIAGPDTGPIRESFPSGTVIVGLRFRPGAAPPWLGVSAAECINGRLPLHDFWGADADRLTDQLGDARNSIDAANRMMAALRARRRSLSLLDRSAPVILEAFARADGLPVRIAALADRLCVSERTLRRRCEIAFGYGPKTLERILRFQRFLRLLRSSSAPRLADLAAASGFADQAHLTRDVRQLGGLTPTEFIARRAA
jgi:AraC-like DNA-binding protein